MMGKGNKNLRKRKIVSGRWFSGWSHIDLIFNRSLCSTKRAYNRDVLVCDYGDTAATETVY